MSSRAARNRAARHTRRSQTTERDDIESSQREVSVSASNDAAVTGTNEDEGGEEVRDFDMMTTVVKVEATGESSQGAAIVPALNQGGPFPAT